MTTLRWDFASTHTLAALSAELQRYFRSKVRGTEEAEDLVSRTWIAVARTFEGRCALRTYAYAVARRMVCEWWRKRRRRLDLEFGSLDGQMAPGPDLESALSDQIERERLYDAIPQIPEPFGETVAMALAGNSLVEIAEALGIEYNTARSRYARGKKHLKELLGAEIDLEDLD